MKALAGFIKTLRVRFHDIELRVDAEPEAGLADSGDLNLDLADLFQVMGKAAQKGSTAIVLSIDELQHVPKDQLAALIGALHRANQELLPVTMVGAGLPQLVGQTGDAKSYAERLFEFARVGCLNDQDAEVALTIPAGREGVKFHRDAIQKILLETQGYPYFLQAWGKHCWTVAKGPTIGLDDARQATAAAIIELDSSFFRVRFDRLTRTQKRYLRAMGRTRFRSAPVRRHRRHIRDQGYFSRSGAQFAYLQGNDLQPIAWRNSIHCPAFQPFHETDYAIVMIDIWPKEPPASSGPKTSV